MVPSKYATTVDDYLIDCRRRGLRPATIRYYGQVLERVGRACDLAEPSDLSLRAGPRLPGRAGAPQPEIGTRIPGRAQDVLALAGRRGRAGGRSTRPVAPAAGGPGRGHGPDRPRAARAAWAAGPLLRTVLALLLGTGVQISDLTDLAVNDVRPGELVVARTKNRAGRLVPLDPVLEALLARHVADRGPVESDGCA